MSDVIYLLLLITLATNGLWLVFFTAYRNEIRKQIATLKDKESHQ